MQSLTCCPERPDLFPGFKTIFDPPLFHSLHRRWLHMNATAFGLKSVRSHVWVCVLRISLVILMKSQLHRRWQGIVKELRGGWGLDWVKQLGKHGGLSTEYLSSGARHSENAKMKFDFQLISRKCSTRGEHKTSRTAAWNIWELRSKQWVCREESTFVQARFTQIFTHGLGCNQTGRKHVCGFGPAKTWIKMF